MTTTKGELRPFQIKVRDLILQGKNVILQAPTGSGKTLAALSPFTTNLERGMAALPLSCLYATPLRVLSTQFYDDYKSFIAYMDKQKGTDYGRRYEHLERLPISIQTGEQSDDPQFESLLTFCTIDQLLASFLSIPYGVGRRRANLNVGAVIGSYLVLDEFPSLSTQRRRALLWRTHDDAGHALALARHYTFYLDDGDLLATTARTAQSIAECRDRHH